MQRVLDSAESRGALPVRLRIKSGTLIHALARLAPSSKSPSLEAVVLLGLAEHQKSDVALHASGFSYLVAGRPQLAVQQFREIAQTEGDAASWNNLAAAEFSAAVSTRDHDFLLGGLADITRALTLGRRIPRISLEGQDNFRSRHAHMRKASTFRHGPTRSRQDVPKMPGRFSRGYERSLPRCKFRTASRYWRRKSLPSKRHSRGTTRSESTCLLRRSFSIDAVGCCCRPIR